MKISLDKTTQPHEEIKGAASSLNPEGKKTADKVDFFVIMGQWLIVGTAIFTTSGFTVFFYGLALRRVSFVTPFCACVASALFSKIMGERLIANGQVWDFKPLAYLVEVGNVLSFLMPRATIVQNQCPGLRNEGLTCFINASLQLVLPFYRQPLLETAEKEIQYHKAWLELCAHILRKDPVDLWTNETIKGILICLSRHKKVQLVPEDVSEGIEAEMASGKIVIDLESCLKRSNLNLLADRFMQFVEAERKETPWPDVGDLLDSFPKCVEFFQKDPTCRKYFEKLQVEHSDYYKAFDSLKKVIENFIEREKLFQGDVTKLTPEEINPPMTFSFRRLRKFMGKSAGGQEDAGEFIINLLSWVRKCEHSELFPLMVMCKELTKFESEDKAVIEKAAKRREEEKQRKAAKNESMEKLPGNGLLKKSERQAFIYLPCPDSKGATGQELLKAAFTMKETELTAKQKAENVMVYEEGNYNISRERSFYEELPDHIMIQLKRFEYKNNQRQKVETPVAFTNEIVIQRQRYKFVFVAAVIHEGSFANTGHYTALVKNKGKLWNCDDIDVTEATSAQRDKAMTQGYLYFFKKDDGRA